MSDFNKEMNEYENVTAHLKSEENYTYMKSQKTFKFILKQ